MKNHRILVSGFDTQGFTVKLDVGGFPFDYYDGVKHELQAEKTEGEVFEIAGINWGILPSRGRFGSHMFFSEYANVTIYPPKVRRSPLISIHGKGVAQFGLEGMHQKLVEFFAHHHVLLDLKKDELVLFRQDWNATVAMPELEIREKDFPRVVDPFEVWKDAHGNIETLYLGRPGSPSFVRVYKKLQAIMARGTQWELDVLRQNGWNEGEEDVLRVEIQMNKAFLRANELCHWSDMSWHGGSAIGAALGGRFPQGRRRIAGGKVYLSPLWSDIVGLAEAENCGNGRRAAPHSEKLVSLPMIRTEKSLKDYLKRFVAVRVSEGYTLEQIDDMVRGVFLKASDYNLIEQTQKRLGIYKRGAGVVGLKPAASPPSDSQVVVARIDAIVQQALDDGSGVPF